MNKGGISADWEDYLPDWNEHKPDREFIADFNRVKSVIMQVAQLPISMNIKNSILFKLGQALDELNVGAEHDD